MTSNFEASKPDPSLANSETDLTPDDFELLSAYIDGELSPAEKKQVQIWLDRDPKIKRIYTQLMSLQGQMKYSVAPPSEKSVAEITADVFQTINTERRRNCKRKLVLGGGAVIASLVAIMSGIVPGTSFGLRMAELELESPSTGNSKSVMLAVAVNKPAINIPKAIEGYSFESEAAQN